MKNRHSETDDNKPPLFLPREASNLQQPFTGQGTDVSGDMIHIKKGIIERIWGHRLRTPAQLSNLFPLTAILYEDLWRKQSLSILGREPFSLEEEFRVLRRWIRPEEGKRYLDVGCSTALYARAIREACKRCDVAALDYARPMLREARRRAAAEQADLFLVRADASDMPFPDRTFDGLAMGGTLNELRKPMRVLRECRRVLRNDGVFFCMYLLKASRPAGKLAQWVARLGGISFWSKEGSSSMFRKAGFRVKKRLSMGVVCIVLLEPAEQN